MLEIINGDIFDVFNTHKNGVCYLAHQCNCITRDAKGLARDVFNKFPKANIYQNRCFERYIPGTIIVVDNIINIFGQREPGRPIYNGDLSKDRLNAFRNALVVIASEIKEGTVLFPYKIGCGYGGGVWEEYFTELQQFSEVAQHLNIVIVHNTNLLPRP